MKKRLAKLPSPAMAVAFVALLAALTGTAVALPGSNTVTSGDIKAGAVTTSDVKNSTVRGRDVRNNTLTGSDVNEGSLGTVPKATSADSASFATGSGFASNAANVARQSISGQGRLNDDDTPVVLFTLAGFRVSLACDQEGTNTESGDDVEVTITNVSAGDGSLLVSYGAPGSGDFDEGETFALTSATDSFSAANPYNVLGSNGGTLSGISSAADTFNVGGTGFTTDCTGSATGQG